MNMIRKAVLSRWTGDCLQQCIIRAIMDFYQHIGKDGDPVDVLVLGETPLAPLSLIKVIPVGVLQTEDEEGHDSKIVAIPTSKIDPSFSAIRDIENIPQYLKDQIKHFFEHYKELEKGKFVKISGWKGKESAIEKITQAIESYEKENQTREL